MFHLTMLTLFGLALIILQGGLPLSMPSPNMTIILAVYMGQFYMPIPSLMISFVFGYIIDSISGGLMGLNAFSMVNICFLSYILSNWVVVQNSITQMALIFIGYLIYAWIVYLLFLFFNFEVAGLPFIYSNLVDAGIVAFLSLLIVPFTRKMEQWFRFINERVTRAGSIEL